MIVRKAAGSGGESLGCTVIVDGHIRLQREILIEEVLNLTTLWIAEGKKY